MEDNQKRADIDGKRILLIGLPGYPVGIIKKMRQMGAEVDFVRDKPNEGFFCKTLGRLQIKPYLKILDKYYYNELSELQNQAYDYVLVIRGEYTTKNAVRKIRQMFPGAKIILYMWDGLHKSNTKGIEEKWPLYDKVYTFDRIDYENNKSELSFLPLYYYEEYVSGAGKGPEDEQYTYDVSFIGTGHADRIKIVKNVMQQCREAGLKDFTYFYIPHPFVYIWNKLTNRNFRGVRIKDVSYKMLPFETVYDTYRNSKCVIDVENPGQHGLTMRSIEIIGLKRKFVTTNKDIINYDFYNPDNIMIIDRKNPEVDLGFFKKPYALLPDSIYKKYSLENWILEVLS